MLAKTPARRFNILTCAIAFALPLACPSLAFAEGSEWETPRSEQQDHATEAKLPEAVQLFVDYMQDFDARYPDSGAVDVDQVIAEEGETIARLYCDAIGVGAPCAPVGDDGGFVATGGTAARGIDDWWEWLVTQDLNVGVIPEVNSCPSQYSYVQIYMDDENTRNANNRSGWIGATASGTNTAWRFCKLTTASSVQFRPLPSAGAANNYAVQNMGVFCPPGATRVGRFHDNQGGSNSNSSIGNVFPSVNVLGRNWLVFACHYAGGAYSPIGPMTVFPNLNMKYGVFGPDSSPYGLLKGWVYQDDEDFANLNSWINQPGTTIFSETTNTKRRLMRVR
jgi:hypothetical protein